MTALAAFYLILLGGNTARAQVITNIFPDGSYQFQYTNKLVFNVISSASITNITLSLQATPLGGVTILKVYSIGNGLTITGTSTSNNVSVALSSNVVYAATFAVGDSAGNTATKKLTFDTLNPSYIFEAEDWDYNSGSFINNPQTNAYANLGSVSGIDFNSVNPGSGSASYRPQGLETEGAGDVPRAPYIGTTNQDYDIGFNNGGNWASYTRNYPAGKYNLFLRGSGGNGPQADAASVTVASGTATLSGTGPYQFSVAGLGWQTYTWCPLIDTSTGNPAQITFDGTASKLQVTIDKGNCNENFYMLVPVNTNTPPTPSIVYTNVYPDGVYQFEQTNTFTFTAQSTIGIDPSSIIVELSGVNLLGQNSGPTILSGAGGLTVTGSSTSYTVTFALTTNTIYSAFIQALDLNGAPTTTTITFDTISPGYFTFEAEDWDYSGGQYYDNPQDGANAIDPLFPAANEYYNLDAVPEEDFHMVGGIAGYNGYAYRGTAIPVPTLSGLNTEGCGDKKRTQYTNSLPGGDYDNGNTHAGDWGNYTRHYPTTGIWNIYMRAANGQSGAGGRGVLTVVTNGYQTTTPQTTAVGTFTPVPPTGNWQAYTWVPLVDSSANLVRFDPTQYHHNADGSLTLQYTSGGGYNANFFMFSPADTTLPIVTGLYPDGLVQFENTNTLSFTAVSSVGIVLSSISVTLNGINVSSSLVITGSSTSYHVSYPHLLADTSYSAVISIKSTEGAVYNDSYTFNTFNPNYYQWESVDWNYTANGVSGLFIENQVDAYANLTSSNGIDVGQSNPNTLNNPFDYRPYDQINLTPSQEPASTTPRPQFIAAGKTDYKGEYVENGTWMNYTRHFPSGTYYVYGTFTSGNTVNTSATLSKVTSSPASPNQTTSPLGTFIIPVSGWGSFSGDYLTDGSGNPVKVTFDGTLTTLQFGGNPAGDGLTCNTGFFMLIPAVSTPVRVTLTARVSGGNILISFPSQASHNYQVQWTGSLPGGAWTNLGSPIAGDGTTKTASEPVAGNGFYRVQIQ